jgi:hypothetical protein
VSITDTPAWRRLRDRWPAQDGLRPLLGTLTPDDMLRLAELIRANTAHDASIAENVLRAAYSERAELLTALVLQAWLRSLAVVHALEIERWQSDPTDEHLGALYYRFLDRVPVGVSIDDLLDVIGGPDDDVEDRGDSSRTATYIAPRTALHLWANADGKYWSSKLA